jgi:hypothetical protein
MRVSSQHRAPAVLYPQKWPPPPRTHWIGGWVDLRAGLVIRAKGKAVPLHATKTLGGKWGTAPTHSQPRHYRGVSGQRHAPAAFLGPGKEPQEPIVQEAGWAPEPVWTQATRKILCFWWGSNLDRPVVQPVASYYIDWATRLTWTQRLEEKILCLCRWSNADRPVCSQKV